MAKLQIDLPVLLPDVPDARDACIARLQELVLARPGITEAHVADKDGTSALCIHYEPNVLSVAEVERLAKGAGVTVTNRYGHAVLELRAIDGEDAARRIESELLAIDGVVTASVSLAGQVARVEFDQDRTNRDAIRRELEQSRYATPASASKPAASKPAEEHSEGDGHDHSVDENANWYQRNKELAWSLIGGLLWFIGWVGERWFDLPSGAAFVIFAGSYVFGAWDLARHSLGNVRKGRFTFDIDLLMLLAALGAALLGEMQEGAFLLFLFSLAHALEHYALGRARNAIRALAELAPSVARVRRNGRDVEEPIEQIAVGDIVIVLPAERLPVDGEVVGGRSSVNQAPVTGESVPVEKEAGMPVFAGTVNGEGVLEIKTTSAVGDRTLDRVIKLVEEAQTQKAPTQQFTERFERIFVPTVLVADVLLIVVPALAGWWTWNTSFYRGMALLVAASPCALALGTPAAVLTGIAQAARRGVLIKGGAYLENLGSLRAIAFDKTGTLTVGRPEVTDVTPVEGAGAEELLSVAAAVERRSQHPLAEAVVRRAESDGVAIPDAGEVQSVTARGIRSTVNGQTVEIGNLRLWQESGVAIPASVSDAIAKLQESGRSVMAVRYGDRWLGVLGVADQPRDGVQGVLERLRSLGLKPLVMLTGDNSGVGNAIGKTVGVDEVRADLLPEDKVTAIRELLDKHGDVAMIGDGVNDAPALAHATVGIAMGGAGTAAALETADVALMSDDLGRLPFAIGLSRQARGVIRQNLYVSMGVIALLIVATTTGIFGIGPTVLVHEGSSLVVIGNALRLLAYNGPRA